MKFNTNQPSAADTMKSIDNNHVLQIQEIKIHLHKRGEQEEYSEHDVNNMLHMIRVSLQYPPVPASKPITSILLYVVRALPQAWPL